MPLYAPTASPASDEADAPAACNVALDLEGCIAGLGREAALWAFNLASNAALAAAIRREANRLLAVADACESLPED